MLNLELPPESVAITLPAAADVADVASPFMYINSTRAVDAPLESVLVQTYIIETETASMQATGRLQASQQHDDLH